MIYEGKVFKAHNTSAEFRIHHLQTFLCLRIYLLLNKTCPSFESVVSTCSFKLDLLRTECLNVFSDVAVKCIHIGKALFNHFFFSFTSNQLPFEN